jgi:hypothetical protein
MKNVLYQLIEGHIHCGMPRDAITSLALKELK